MLNEEFVRRVELLDNRMGLDRLKFDLYSILPHYIFSDIYFENIDDLLYFTDAVMLEHYDHCTSRHGVLVRLLHEIYYTEDRDMLISVNKFIQEHVSDLMGSRVNSLVDLYNKYSRTI